MSTTGSLASSALGLGSVTGTLSQSAILAAQELGTAVGGQAFGSAAAGAVGQLSAAISAASSASAAFAVSGLLGKFAGQAVGRATGSNAAGIATGAAAGAVIGSVVPVIGTIIGAIIGAVAGITPSQPRGFESADFSSGSVRIRKQGKKGFDAGDLDKPINQISASIFELNKALDLDLDIKKIKFFIGFDAFKGFRANIEGKDKNFSTVAQAQGAIFKEEVTTALPKKERTKFQNKVLERAFAPENDLFVEQLKSIKKDLEVRERLKKFTKVVEFDPAIEKTKELEKQIKKLGKEFGSLKKEAQELGLDTKRAEAAFKKQKRLAKDEILGIQIQKESEKISTQQQAFQLAGRQLPREIQEAGLKLQFDALGIAFRKLGLDTTILAKLLNQGLAEISDAQNAARVQVQTQAFQIAGREVPKIFQEAAVKIQFKELEKQFTDLGLDTTILTELIAEALANIEDTSEGAKKLSDQINVQAQAFQLAGRQVPIALQRIGVQLQFDELGEQFRKLGS